jgi:hypothetical protein
MDNSSFYQLVSILANYNTQLTIGDCLQVAKKIGTQSCTEEPQSNTEISLFSLSLRNSVYLCETLCSKKAFIDD